MLPPGAGVPGVAVQKYLHAGCDGKIGEEALVKAPPSDQPHRGLGAAHGANGEQSQRRAAVGKFFALEKSGLAGLRCRWFRITKSRRVLRRTDHVAVGADDLEKIKLGLLRQRLRLGEIRGAVARLHDFECHGAHVLRRGQAIDGRGHLGRVVLELALELADDERRVLLIALIEDGLDANQNGPRDRDHRRSHCERHQQQELLAEAHGASSSEAPARSGVPAASRRRSRTRPEAANARGR